MRLKLYCNRYEHFKDALVCSINCVYRTRCRDFALFYDARRDDVDAAVAAYLEARRVRSPANSTAASNTNPNPANSERRALPLFAPTSIAAAAAAVLPLFTLEVKREMAEATYIWIDKDDRAELLEHTEVIRRAEKGSKAKSIYRVAQEMELRYQLVPRKGIEKAKRSAAADATATAERAAARSNSRLRSVAPEPTAAAPPQPAAAPALEVPASTTSPTTRRTRTGTLK